MTIGDNVQIAANSAVANGGGIYVSNFITGNTVPISLTITGNALINQNTANNGAGLYLFATNSNDAYIQTGTPSITNNTAGNNGAAGFLNFLAPSQANVTITGGTVTDNTANFAAGGFQVSSAGGGTCDLSNVIFSGNSAGASQAGDSYIQIVQPILQTSRLMRLHSKVIRRALTVAERLLTAVRAR